MLYLLLGGLGYSVFLLIFIACPLIGKLILLALNVAVPDPLPYIDEIVMVGSTIGNLFRTLERGEKLINFISEHKLISVIIGIVLIVVIKLLFF